MALTKHDIVEQIQSKLGFPRNESIEITESLLETIKSSLESGDDVLISGFGKFCIQEKKERNGRNPATGETLTLKPRKRPLSYGQDIGESMHLQLLPLRSNPIFTLNCSAVHVG